MNKLGTGVGRDAFDGEESVKNLLRNQRNCEELEEIVKK